MTYLTGLHWMALLIIGSLSILIVLLTLKNTERKALFAPIMANLLITSLLIAFTFYALDKYTKIARLENMVQKKVTY